MANKPMARDAKLDDDKGLSLFEVDIPPVER
jgi:hypothetical protein